MRNLTAVVTREMTLLWRLTAYAAQVELQRTRSEIASLHKKLAQLEADKTSLTTGRREVSQSCRGGQCASQRPFRLQTARHRRRELSPQ